MVAVSWDLLKERTVKGFQERLPILLSVTFVTAIVGLSVNKLRFWTGVSLWIAIALVVSYLLWLVVEAKVAVKELDKGKTSLDRGTLELYAFARAATVLTALGIPAGTEVSVRGYVGFGLFLAAVTFRLVAIRELGRFYSHRVRVVGGHKIIDTGPYRFVRHPAYTGMLFAHLGVVLFFFNWVSLGILLVLFVPAVVLRIRIEEQVLMELDGYAEYSRGRPRILPLVW